MFLSISSGLIVPSGLTDRSSAAPRTLQATRIITIIMPYMIYVDNGVFRGPGACVLAIICSFLPLEPLEAQAFSCLVLRTLH